MCCSKSYSRRVKELALGVERGPDSGVGRNGPQDSTLDPTLLPGRDMPPTQRIRAEIWRVERVRWGPGGALEA